MFELKTVGSGPTYKTPQESGRESSYNHEVHEDNIDFVNELYKNMFFDNWKKGREKMNRAYDKLEIILNSECNLGCKYCYLNRHEDKLFPEELRDNDNIIKNVEKIIDWMIEEEFQPHSVELFSGALFGQKIGYDTLELFYEKYKDIPELARHIRIVIPTNFTFIHSEELTEKVKDIINRLKSIGIWVSLSASFDGKHMEQNRPYKKNLDYDLDIERDDEYYEKVFKFVAEMKTGLHPMVYSHHIEDWKKNFLWFQEMMKKHDIPWDRIFLLEVRNAEWSKKQIKEFHDFILFLFDWVGEKIEDKEELMRFLSGGQNGFNLLNSTSGSNGRGISCSLQSSFAIRAADLTIPPCHRLSYDNFNTAYLEEEDGKITGRLIPLNAEFAISMKTYNYKDSPFCETCDIQASCIGGCLGSQYETMKDPLLPIPTVCVLEHAKVKAIVEGWMNLGIFKDMIGSGRLTEQQAAEHIEIYNSILKRRERGDE